MIICRCDNLYEEILNSTDDSFENNDYVEKCIRDSYIDHLSAYHSNMNKYYVITGDCIYGLDDSDGPYLNNRDTPLYVIDNKYNQISFSFRSDQSLLITNTVNTLLNTCPNIIQDNILSYLYCYLCCEYCFRDCEYSSHRKKVYIN
jgi:hypothetical protein